MSKIIGYILALVGILGVAMYTIPQLKNLVPLPAQLSGSVLLIVSLVVAVIGIFLIVKRGGGSKQVAEVPIYSGKNVVGFRRLGKR